METKHTGLFFGSFNPVHNGHLMIANYLTEFESFDQVWLVISPLNPFKSNQDLLPDYHRRELLVRAIGDYPRLRVSSVEFRLPKPSYTIDTLDVLKRDHPDHDFILIMGSDQLDGFPNWKQSERILEENKIRGYPRSSGTGTPPGNGIIHHKLFENKSITLIDAPMIEVSSTFIRKAIHEGKDMRFYMPSAAWQYLDEMHFYR